MGDPFIYSGVDGAYKIVMQGPELGLAHLSSLSIEKLKTIAQLFDYLAGKYRPFAREWQKIAVFYGGISLFSFGMGVTGVRLDQREIKELGFLFFCAFGVLSMVFATGLGSGFQMRHYDNWKNYALDVLTVKLDAQ